MIRPAFVLVLMLMPGPAASQLRGTVTSEDGAPIPEATVELWGDSARLGATMTAFDGRFSIARSPGARRLTVRRVGFGTVSRPVPPGDAEFSIALSTQAVLVEGVVAAPGRLCPGADQPAARALWNAVRSRYPASASGRSAYAVLRRSETDVTRERLGEVDDRTMHYGFTWQHAGVSLTDAQVDADGYARELPWRTPWTGYTPDNEYFAWKYLDLHELRADHFASEVFGRRHQLRVLSSSAGETVLAFCPLRGARGPEVEGTLSVASDSSFASATWRFRTPGPDEQAGGEAVFAAPTGAPLTAVSSAFWRLRVGRQVWRQTANTWIAWWLDVPHAFRPPCSALPELDARTQPIACTPSTDVAPR